jgi:hypothetical protein
MIDRALQKRCHTKLIKLIGALVLHDELPMKVELHLTGLGHVYIPAGDFTIGVTDRGWIQIWRGDNGLQSELDTRSFDEAAAYVAQFFGGR